MAVFIQCNACRGAGRVAHHELTETMALVGYDWASTSSIADGLRMKRTAATNRLVRLLDLGLVERQKKGREYHWRRVDA